MSSLNIATTALTSNLAALKVIGHNIANVNTEGYSRQTAELQSLGGQMLGNGYFGKGVEIAGVERAYDAYLTRQAQLTRSVAAGDEVRFQKLQQLEALFPMGETGMGAALNAALNAWVDVASSPTDLTARTVAISRSEEFAARLRDTTARLDELRHSSAQQIDAVTTDINKLAVEIAGLNQRILATQGTNGAPNDLLDQREKLIGKLNDYVQTTSVRASDGTVSVFVAGSQPLVLGIEASKLQVVKDSQDPTRLRVDILRSGGAFQINEDFLRGGQLSGLLQYVNQDLPDTYNSLGRLALSLAEQINGQHRLGLDLSGKPGGDFYTFTDLSPGNPASGNTGDAIVSVSVSDPTQFIASDYEVRFISATEGSIVRLSDGKSMAFSALPPPVVDGFSLSVSAGTANAGDTFRVRPFSDVSRNIQVALSSPNNLAASSPVKITPNLQADSGLTLENISLIGGSLPAAPATLPNFSLSYDAATGRFDVSPVGLNLSGPQAYSPGQPLVFRIDLGAGQEATYSLRLRGSPTHGDAFDLAQGTGIEMRQNYGNAQAILNLRTKDSFEGVGLGDGYIGVFSQLAAKVQAGRFSAEFSSSSAVSAETARANVSGVNLDEEAARLIQYQQAYQASAKFLQVAQGTFDSLIQSFR